MIIGSAARLHRVHQAPQPFANREAFYAFDDPGCEKLFMSVPIGTIFPALPGVTEGFTLLAMEPGRVLTLGWLAPDGTTEVTWTFVLHEATPGVTRLLVRARGESGYRFHGLPPALTRIVVRFVHFIMQRKQLLGITHRAESMPVESLAPADRSSSADKAAA